MAQARSASGKKEVGRGRSPEPLDFFIWTVEAVVWENWLGDLGKWNLSCCVLPLMILVFRFCFCSGVESYALLRFYQDVGLWLEEINLGGYRQVFEENGVNGEYLESLSMFTTEQILRFIRRCHMKWGDFITLCKELRRIKVACLKGEQEVRRPWWAPSCLSVVFVRAAKQNRKSRVVSLKLEP
ncbi:hypothetical protein GQ55_3G421400 [Panicum hallii var. hallii]|uniref:SAM domain-containing protein n=1 Tax=Panicum hallii var. hallii TaxID=1504633 RepID=A0A2T7EHG8_9POAL|nr:uncharacterized protein LOC112887743 isoform X1 [Panicum hallii]PUZ67268.1 hypothetical protein GQ55_3G421400 [Panicum hallii var. hallii]